MVAKNEVIMHKNDAIEALFASLEKLTAKNQQVCIFLFFVYNIS
jgi:hypothetical protein